MTPGDYCSLVFSKHVDFSASLVSRRIRNYRESRLVRYEYDLMVNKKKYRVLSQLGQSASEVVLALDSQGRKVAIKLVSDNIAQQL